MSGTEKVKTSVEMTKYVAKSFVSENKLFIEFTPLDFQTAVFQRLELFWAIKSDK